MTEATEAKPEVDAGAEWLDALLASSHPERLRMARWAAEHNATHDRGAACWMGNHDERLAEYEKRNQAVREALVEIDGALPEMSEAGRAAALSILHRIGREVGYHPR